MTKSALDQFRSVVMEAGAPPWSGLTDPVEALGDPDDINKAFYAAIGGMVDEHVLNQAYDGKLPPEVDKLFSSIDKNMIACIKSFKEALKDLKALHVVVKKK